MTSADQLAKQSALMLDALREAERVLARLDGAELLTSDEQPTLEAVRRAIGTSAHLIKRSAA